MKTFKPLIAALLAAPLFASAANLVSNGSFESGLTGWTLDGSVGDAYPATIIDYNSNASYPTGAFNEPVPGDSSLSLSPDAVGTHAAYFVSDTSTQTLSQQVFLNAGLYSIGFSAYTPSNGFRNTNDAFFSGSIAGVSLASFNVGSRAQTTWNTFSGIANIQTAGTYEVKFAFSTNGYPAKDIVIDRVYVVSTVPEPESYAMMLAGLGLMGAIARRRKAKVA